MPAWLRAAAWYVLTIGVWCAVRVAHTRYLGWGSGFDVDLYASYGRGWAQGLTPYVDFSPEYPPGAMFVFLVPYLRGDWADYGRMFSYEMAFFDLGSKRDFEPGAPMETAETEATTSTSDVEPTTTSSENSTSGSSTSSEGSSGATTASVTSSGSTSGSSGDASTGTSG